ncbi:ATP-binding protein [Micromonospora sp. NPDC050397]|uniref:ATP-binding protein n=1 Tax=Micromonospora sp. NPDC050397 TaxID=3364279 RepID=UPI00384E6015
MSRQLPNESSLAETARLLLVVEFDVARFTDVRREVDSRSRECRISPEKADDFVAAVNEIMINAIRHGGGRGELRLWQDAQLTCEIRDHGPGFAADNYLNRAHRPSPSADGGMGLWIVQTTSDTLSIVSDPTGTTVVIGATLTPIDAG